MCPHRFGARGDPYPWLSLTHFYPKVAYRAPGGAVVVAGGVYGGLALALAMLSGKGI